MTITGGCLCGAVRYEVTAEPLAARTCWCRLCQYLGGGTATANVAFPSDAVTITGELADYESVADSGNVMHRGFCPKCGTPVTSAAEARPHLIFLRGGTLDDTSIAAPQATIWTSQAPAWACIDETIPSHPAQVPPAA
ncbi:GFA family protein [Sphingomonas piscis]|uniref:GFA family protein n=1 Tax=Sphingomonas piscis TaxID=2714943 RepID=A0A6G7YRF9_9SPHN|nr:GFA family protein [Sphingomonas piscis]QIK79321.1 GFA family protein [Sphingomonas piscis]